MVIEEDESRSKHCHDDTAEVLLEFVGRLGLSSSRRVQRYRQLLPVRRYNCTVWGFCRYRTFCTGYGGDLRLTFPKKH
jgi:hypothetical protein